MMRRAVTMNEMKPFELSKRTGNIGLDFINSANFHRTENHQEWFNSEMDVMKWADYTGISVEEDSGSAMSLAEMIELREVMYRLALHAIKRTIAAVDDRRTFNEWIKQAHKHTEVTQNEAGVFEKKLIGAGGLTNIAYVVVLAFGDLIMSKTIQKVKQCQSSRCEWLFIDQTKNQSKQWCSMKVCGNREKAKRFYHSTKK